jgi:4-carboxymuconolactone decarboxylase
VAQDPDAAKAFLAWGGYILSKRNGLAAREREIVILRTGFLCKSGYEWTQHVRIGLDSGLSEAEIVAIKVGPSDPSWNDLDRLLIQASDELFHEKFIATKTWDALAEHLSQKQLMDLVFTVGQYTLVSMFLNSFGVQLDSGQTLDPELKGF